MGFTSTLAGVLVFVFVSFCAPKYVRPICDYRGTSEESRGVIASVENLRPGDNLESSTSCCEVDNSLGLRSIVALISIPINYTEYRVTRRKPGDWGTTRQTVCGLNSKWSDLSFLPCAVVSMFCIDHGIAHWVPT